MAAIYRHGGPPIRWIAFGSPASDDERPAGRTGDHERAGYGSREHSSVPFVVDQMTDRCGFRIPTGTNETTSEWLSRLTNCSLWVTWPEAEPDRRPIADLLAHRMPRSRVTRER